MTYTITGDDGRPMTVELAEESDDLNFRRDLDDLPLDDEDGSQMESDIFPYSD